MLFLAYLELASKSIFSIYIFSFSLDTKKLNTFSYMFFEKESLRARASSYLRGELMMLTPVLRVLN